VRLEEIRGAVPKKEFRARAGRGGVDGTAAEGTDDAEDAEEVERVQDLADSAEYDDEGAGRGEGVTSGRD
jgi:hypothetical protein